MRHHNGTRLAFTLKHGTAEQFEWTIGCSVPGVVEVAWPEPGEEVPMPERLQGVNPGSLVRVCTGNTYFWAAPTELAPITEDAGQ